MLMGSPNINVQLSFCHFFSAFSDNPHILQRNKVNNTQQQHFKKQDKNVLRYWHIACVLSLGFYQHGLSNNLLYIQLLPQQLKSLVGCQGQTMCFPPVNLFMPLQAPVFSEEPNCVHVSALTVWYKTKLCSERLVKRPLAVSFIYWCKLNSIPSQFYINVEQQALLEWDDY